MHLVNVDRGFLMTRRIMDLVQVNIPFTMLCESYLDRFKTDRLNPEIGFDAQALDGYSLSDVEVVARQLDDLGVRITLHAPFIDLSPGSPDPRVRSLARERLGQFVRLIPLFNPKTVVCHTGYDHKRYWNMKDIWLENSLKIWSGIAEQARTEGAVLMLENTYEQGPDDLLILLENLQDQGVGFCLDTGHQAVFSSTPMEEWVKRMAPFLGQLHLHDNSGIEDEHSALGRGSIDFQNLFNQLMKADIAPPVVTLEPHREEDLGPSLEYLDKIWPW